MTRREALGAFGAAAASAVACACGGGSSPASPTAGATPSAGTPTSAAGCVVAAEETAGPYVDILGMAENPAFFRSDIREGRDGYPLTLNLTVVDVRSSCAPVGNASVEIWQCDAAGRYSEYAQTGYDGRGQTFLRGLQRTDAAGRVTFLTIYPGWYQGRATHIHVKVYVGGAAVKTTQIAFPEDVTAQVYASGVYATKGQNTTRNATDNVFSDGTATEMVTITGSTAGGFTGTLTLGISA
jgi:protocatechuate 3,4-dioxygenase beta subunit